MRLGFRLLDQVKDVNTFLTLDDALTLTRGNAATLYFRLEQIIEPARNTEEREVRYIPATGATAVVNFNHIDSNQAIVARVATNPFPNDTSIWSVPILTTDVCQFNSMSVVLTEGSVISTLLPLTELLFQDTDTSRAFA